MCVHTVCDKKTLQTFLPLPFHVLSLSVGPCVYSSFTFIRSSFLPHIVQKVLQDKDTLKAFVLKSEWFRFRGYTQRKEESATNLIMIRAWQ